MIEGEGGMTDLQWKFTGALLKNKPSDAWIAIYS